MRALSCVSLVVALASAGARAQPASHPPSRVTSPPASPAPAIDKPVGVVNLNNAGEDQLELLPGIGPQKAKAIVEHRRAHPFHKTDELLKVKGIGRKTFGRLRPYLTIVGPSTLTTEIKLRR